MTTTITLRDIFMARKTVAPLIRETPLLHSPPLSVQTGASVYLKLETLQKTGAFKMRGAANKICGLGGAEQARGVVTVSTGNHGRAVAYVAAQLGINAAICISERVPANKVAALQQLGAEVVVYGRSQDDAGERAAQLQEARGLTMIHPFDDPFIIAGQGTIGLELLHELPEVDTVLVPLSGGGLISGIALALKTADPAIRVIGVSMERAPVMYHSLQAGRPLQMAEEKTLADSLQGGIGLHNRYTYALVQDCVDEIVLVSEEEIAAAMAFAFHEHQLVVEGAGAVGIAALLQEKVRPLGHHVALVLSGGNVDTVSLLEIAQTHQG